jgi:hypothetical protein
MQRVKIKYVQLSLCVIQLVTMKTYAVVEV